MNPIADKCREAESFSLDAIEALAKAQTPESDGGTAITPREAQGVRMLSVCAALASNDAAHMAEGSAPAASATSTT